MFAVLINTLATRQAGQAQDKQNDGACLVLNRFAAMLSSDIRQVNQAFNCCREGEETEGSKGCTAGGTQVYRVVVDSFCLSCLSYRLKRPLPQGFSTRQAPAIRLSCACLVAYIDGDQQHADQTRAQFFTRSRMATVNAHAMRIQSAACRTLPAISATPVHRCLAAYIQDTCRSI